VAGVPPDAFSRTGQLWGNPLYRWDVHEKTQFAFWVDRLGGALERFDAVRLDHFIGFHRSWQVRAGARTAIRGRFVENPGDALFDRLERMLGGLPFIAEDLGIVTDAVHGLRERWQLAGMRVLQFGFGDGATLHLPHRYPRRALVCTGTHDTHTIVGWYRALSPAERRRVAAYAGVDPRRPHRAFIRLVLGSVAQLAILPLQDALALGDAARMNRPGTPRGNWEWRATGRELNEELANELAALVRLYERTPL
jgi:4-alpha-glucanotransferase